MRKSIYWAAAVLMLVFPVALYARGADETPPQVQLQRETGVHISPNGDGVQDELRLAPVVGEGATLAIKSFRLTIFGADEELSGAVIWTKMEVQTENRRFLGDLFNVGEEPQVVIPDTLTWDGTFLGSDAGSDGAVVPDGEYIYQLAITDENGATTTTPPTSVTVDRAAPAIDSVQLSYSIFSPNDDGVRDDVSVEQSGSRELSWVGTITDSTGAIVRTFLWENATPRLVSSDGPPPAFRWDGTDDAGAVVADGTYEYTLTGTDRAGNTSTSDPVSIAVSTRAGAVQLQPRTRAFSPNGDGSQDTLVLDTVVAEPLGLVRYEITLEASGTAGDALWSTSGEAPVPDIVTLRGVDSRGRPLADGSYQVQLVVHYENGNTAESEPVTVTIDTVAPRGSITMQTGPAETESGTPFVFGGENKRYVDFHVSLGEQSDWVAIVNYGETVHRVPVDELGINGTSFSFRWDGTGLDGTPVPDGLASLRFDTVDDAGNAGMTNQVQVYRDTSDAEVAVRFAGDYLSPDGDGINDSVQVQTVYSVAARIDQFLLSIADESGRVVRTEYKRTPFTSFEWLGRSNGNTVVADGEYTATLKVVYLNGNEPTAQSGPITVDRTNPEVIELTAPYRLFSPDGDGERDTVTIHQSTSSEDEWRGTITDSSGTVVFERVWTGVALDFTWDGTDLAGNVVEDGDFTYRVTATDVAGNSGGEDLTLVVDTRSAPVSQQPPAVSLTVAPLPFTPDGDGTNDRLTITSLAASENTLARWELIITDPHGGQVRTWSGRGAPRRFITWDGTAPNGELVQSAQQYSATLRVTDDKGNAGTETAVIDVGILVIREGQRLRIMVPSIHFAPNTSDLFAVAPEELEQNLDTLRNLAAVLNRYPDHEILIEGHAAHDYYVDGPRKDREQREELIPLSSARAVEVKQALIILGVAADRMRTVGIGGARPIVPHSDRVNLWKNRRVEFILERR